ncbi:MAG TPA: rRNA maturation RNase YbeY [Opitutaceae bacterium]|nr:rRNA maturation RNase YbeY [Opitutaceae bacterium]
MKGGGRTLDVANRHPRLRIDRKALAAAVRLLDAHAGSFKGGCPPGGLSVAFLEDRALADLHARFLGDPSATDVITFSGDPAANVAGEICVSVDAAARRAGTAAARLSAEIALYLVHGWLHLAGYDDRDPSAKRAMRRAEARAMRLLARSRSVPRFKLA